MRLRDTREFVHPSVRVRVAGKGPGVGGKGAYDPPALKGWRRYAPGEAFEGKANPWPAELDRVWKWVAPSSGNGKEAVWVAEERMGEGEMAMLEEWPEVKAEVEART